MDKRVTSLHFQVMEWVLTVVCTYAPNSSYYPPFMESLKKVLEKARTGDSIVLLRDFNTHPSNDSDTSGGASTTSWRYYRAQNLNGPCFALSLSRWLFKAVVARLLVLILVVTPGAADGHQRWKEVSS